MKMQQMLLLLAVVLLLISVGIVVAQSSSSFSSQRFVMLGGGSADSASYTLYAVMGQTATDVADSSNYRVSAGFLAPFQRASGSNNTIWLPVIFK